MAEWWSSLAFFQKLLYYVAIPSTLILLIQTLMTFTGMGDDGMDLDGDFDGADFDGDFELGLEIFTIRNFIAFVTFFGWGALWAFSIGKSQTLSIVLGLVSGLIMMFISAGFFYLMKKMTASGNLRLDNAVGRVGEVYLKIPPKQSGVGKIQINVQETLRELEVMTASEVALERGTLVKVIGKVSESILLVEKIEEK